MPSSETTEPAKAPEMELVVAKLVEPVADTARELLLAVIGQGVVTSYGSPTQGQEALQAWAASCRRAAEVLHQESTETSPVQVSPTQDTQEAPVP